MSGDEIIKDGEFQILQAYIDKNYQMQMLVVPLSSAIANGDGSKTVFYEWKEPVFLLFPYVTGDYMSVTYEDFYTAMELFNGTNIAGRTEWKDIPLKYFTDPGRITRYKYKL